METSELSDAREAVRIITGDNVHVYWAPGDATRYRVALLHTVAYGPYGALTASNDMLMLMVLIADDPRTLVLSSPRYDEQRWTPERFVRQFGEEFAGWWAGVRPLLAALGWTTPEFAALNYDPGDADVVGELVTVGRGT